MSSSSRAAHLRRAVPALTAGLALTLASGCVDVDDGEVVVLGHEPPAEVRLDGDSPWFGVLEYGNGWGKELLGVCWEPSAFGATPEQEASFAQAREWVRDIVRAEWGRASRISFTEIWPACGTPGFPDDLRIGHDSSIAGWSVQGTNAQAIATGPTMIVNLVGPWDAGCVPGPGSGGGGGVIAACNGLWLGGAIQSREVWTQALALHLFGYALGLRKENPHPDAAQCGNINETLDGHGGDGEPLWSYDASSLMEGCTLMAVAAGSARPRLSVGDLRSLNSLYPSGARLYASAELGGTVTTLGPGYYTRATLPALANLRSLVVPPGYRVTACTSSSCYLYTASRRTLPVALHTGTQNVAIGVQGFVAADAGFLGAQQWLNAGAYRASQGQLATVGNDTISSAWVPPGLAITLCDLEPGAAGNACITSVGGSMGWPVLVKIVSLFGSGLDDRASYVNVTRRAVTYSGSDLRGAAYSLATGTYTVSGGSSYLPAVRSILLPAGLEAVACNSESTFTFPRPICQTFTQSGPVTVTGLAGNIRRLEVRVPLVNHP